MAKKDKADPRSVRGTFDYIPETGRLVRVRNKTSGKIGRLVGHIENSGNNRYRRIPFADSAFQASWMVWAWHHGEFPGGSLIHKNGDNLDDRIENLALYRNMRRPVKVAHELPEEDQPNTMLGDLPDHLNTGIYEIRNIKNGRRYIGSAVNVSKRWRQHLKQLEEDRHHSQFMQRCWNKNGGESFIFRVILACSPENLLMYEQAVMDSVRPQYNSNPTASSMLGFRHSQESRKKMSTSRPKNFSPFAGKKHTEETRKIISDKKSGVKLGKYSDERIRKTAKRVMESKSVLNEDSVRQIRKMITAGVSYKEIAKAFSCRYSAVADIARNKTFKWVK